MPFPAGGYEDLDAAAADGVVHYWPMDEESGGTVADVVGGVHGVMFGDAVGDSIVSGPFTRARKLTYILNENTVEDAIVFNPGGAVDTDFDYGAWTISMAVRLVTVDGYNQLLFLAPSQFVCQERFDLWVNNWDFPGDDEHLFFGTFNCSSNSLVPDGSPIPAATSIQWGRLTAVYDGATGELTLYYNGITGRTVSAGLEVLKVKAAPWAAGAFYAANTETISDSLDGELADLAIWDRALSSQEVANLWNSGDLSPVVLGGGAGPSDPDPGDEWEPLPEIPGAIVLSTHIGGGDETMTTGRYTSPEYDAEWSGFTGNYSSIDSGAAVYPRRFQVDTPEIQAEVRDPAEGARTADYDMAIPIDMLDLEV